ncbi:MAG: undecaprenyl-phosphate glucose phosphotransferase [Rhizobiaceae bacterium]|nr:undecaprenyl-phosphate glucose phosphotransferase [Rhizobiaceae bacterium]
MDTQSLKPEHAFTQSAVKSTVIKDKTDTVELNALARQVAEQFASDVVSPHLISAFVRLVEFLGLMALGLGLYGFYVWPDTDIQSKYLIASAFGSFLTVCFIQAMDGYQTTSLRNLISQTSKVVTGFTVALMFVLLIAFFTKTAGEFSRVWFGAWFAMGIVFLVMFRIAVSVYVKRLSANGRLERRAVIVGGGEPAAELIRSLEAQSGNDIRICGIFDDRAGDRSPAIVAGYPKLGNVKELVEFGRKARIDMLIVSLPLSAESRVLQLLKRLWVLPVDIRLSAHTNKLRFRPRSYSYEGAVPFLDVFDKPIADWDAIMKRTFDLVFSVIALVLLSPVMIATALAIKWESKGPVFFRQKRYGFNNELVNVWKFRSMFHEMASADASIMVTKGDSRVTRVGKFIRKTSIDELPQLFNVLTGKLSLVGPRPHALNAHAETKLYDQVVDGYFARHKVKPGITGWAQINGWRGETDVDEKIIQRVNCDLYYIENWSLMLDFYILFITPIKLLNSENAY